VLASIILFLAWRFDLAVPRDLVSSGRAIQMLAFRRVGVAALLAAVLVLPTTAWTAGIPFSPTLRLEPHAIGLTLRPGERLSGKVAVTNTGSSPASIRLSALDRQGFQGQAEPAVELRTSPSAAGWIGFSPSSGDLEPGERREFEWTVVVPESGVLPGDYSTRLVADSVQQEGAGPSSVDRAETMAVVNVPGAAAMSGKIVALDAPPSKIVILPKLLQVIPEIAVTLPSALRVAQPIRASLAFVNDGKARTRASASLLVRENGNVVEEIPAGSAAGILPGDGVEFPAVWANPPRVGVFTVTGHIEMDGAGAIERSFTVYMFPPELVPVVALGLLALAGLLVVLVRRRWMQVKSTRVTAQVPGSLDNITPAHTIPVGAVAVAEPSPNGHGEPLYVGEGRTLGRLLPLTGVGSRSDSEKLLEVAGEADQWLEAGLAALRAGDVRNAHAYFSTVVERDEGCVQGWLLRAGTATSETEARECLRRALSLDPNNSWAIDGLSRLPEVPPQG
jgi:hypothetical protein